MPELSSRDITVLEGLEAIRQRPAMHVDPADGDHSLCSRLVESAVRHAASSSPAPNEVRLTVWAGEAVTVAFDGEPLPVGPYSAGTNDIPHPELYRMFMFMAAPATIRSLSFGAAIVNALSARLVVSTVHDGVRYRAAFSRGALVSLLTKTPTSEPHGTNVLTFEPDSEVVPGAMTVAVARAIVERVSVETPGVKVVVIDSTSRKPDWF